MEIKRCISYILLTRYQETFVVGTVNINNFSHLAHYNNTAIGNDGNGTYSPILAKSIPHTYYCFRSHINNTILEICKVYDNTLSQKLLKFIIKIKKLLVIRF